MEPEFFCKPGEDMEWFEYAISAGTGCCPPASGRKGWCLRDHKPDPIIKSHHRLLGVPFPGRANWGIANRTDFDLKQHRSQQQNMEYIDPVTNERFIPYGGALPGR